MLLGNFFKISDSENTLNTYKVNVVLADEHPIFDGHFPGAPVVPGVCQLQMLEETLSHFLKEKMHVTKAHTIKYLVGIEPVKHRHFSMEIKVEKQGEEFAVSATYFNATETFFKFKGELHAA